MCFIVLNKLYNFKVSVLVSAILVLYLLGIGWIFNTKHSRLYPGPSRCLTENVLGAQARSERSPLKKWSGRYTLHTAFLKHMGLRFSRLLCLSCFFHFVWVSHLLVSGGRDMAHTEQRQPLLPSASSLTHAAARITHAFFQS